ncbi:MAG TPA: MBL fold metallo-hydrolase, partial [Rectinema sp.]|nr:MBL fold metallo-hydrolase [Rectinema sp.]
KTVRGGVIGELPSADIPNLDFILVTHAHQDHTAMLPLLVEKGIQVAIYATEPTKEFSITYCKSWLEGYKNFGIEPSYRAESIEKLKDMFVTVPYYSEFSPGKNTHVTFSPSGHLAGSAILYIKDEYRIAHFGDTNFGDTLNPEPYLDFEADIGIINGSYGDRVLAQPELERKFIDYVCSSKNNLLIPAAALGRGQEICLLLLDTRSKIDKDILVAKSIFDNAEKLLNYKEFLRDGAEERISALLASDKLMVMANNEMEYYLRKGSIFVTPDAMLSNGKSVDILDRIKDNPDDMVILSGYLAPGTVGRRLAEGRLSINAKVVLSELKVHTDLADNERILQKSLSRAKLVLVHHREEPKSSQLAGALRQKFHIEVISPHFGDRIIL